MASPFTTLAGLVLAGVVGSAVAQEPGREPAVPVSLLLCDSAQYAMQFADALSEGESDEMARDRVGRSAAAEVCGMFRGVATIESESVTLKDGIAYKLTAYRFAEDRRLAWLAERSFAPPKVDWSL